jgi:hypothetical protein
MTEGKDKGVTEGKESKINSSKETDGERKRGEI